MEVDVNFRIVFFLRVFAFAFRFLSTLDDSSCDAVTISLIMLAYLRLDISKANS
jgi:hypothetical protein